MLCLRHFFRRSVHDRRQFAQNTCDGKKSAVLSQLVCQNFGCGKISKETTVTVRFLTTATSRSCLGNSWVVSMSTKQQYFEKVSSSQRNSATTFLRSTSAFGTRRLQVHKRFFVRNRDGSPNYKWDDTSLWQRGPIPNYFYSRHPDTILQPQCSASEAWGGMLGLTSLNIGVFLMWNMYVDDDDGSAAADRSRRRQFDRNPYYDLEPAAQKNPEPKRVFSEEFMMHQFAINITNLKEGRLWTPLTSSISHQSLGHIVGNMFAFWLFGFPTYRVLGTRAFWGLYGSGGVACSMAHVGHNLVTGRTQPPLTSDERNQIEQFMQQRQQEQLLQRESGGWFGSGGVQQEEYPFSPFHNQQFTQKLMDRLRHADMPSLGASGSVMAISAVSACLFPMDRVRPSPSLLFYIPLPLAVGMFVASDVAGVTTTLTSSDDEDPMAAGSNVDHAGHLGGLIMGIYYITNCWYNKKGSFQFLRNMIQNGDLPIVYRFKQRFYNASSKHSGNTYSSTTTRSNLQTSMKESQTHNPRGRFRL